MRIAIMGAGGIGGYFGARLARAGEDVTFICRGEHLRVLRQQGLRLESPFGDIHLETVRASDSAAGTGHVEVVVFTVKLYDTESATTAILPLVGPKTRVITLQNGIDSVDALARFIPRDQVVGGATYISGYLDRPGVIVHPGGMTTTTIGGQDDAVIEAFRDACARAGHLDIKIVKDVESVLWFKFVVLSAFAGATSLMRSGIGPIIDDPEARVFVEQLRDEGMAIALAAGHPMPEGFQKQVSSIWSVLPPDTRSSMANDLMRGKRIELAWLSGRMHELGSKLRVPTPAHTAVYRALHLHANGFGLPHVD